MKPVRQFIGKQLFKKCGNNVTIERGAVFHSGAQVSLGNNSGIGENARIAGPIEIGNDVMMGPNCIFWTRNHASSRMDIPMTEQGFEDYKPVIVGNDVWIGCNVVFYPGVKVGNGVIVRYASVVTEDVPDYAVVMGNPAKIVSYRKSS